VCQVKSNIKSRPWRDKETKNSETAERARAAYAQSAMPALMMSVRIVKLRRSQLHKFS
jgi:hypothetical protein